LIISHERKGQKNSVHATISDESYEILQQFKEEFGSKSAVVDAGLKSLKKLKEPHLEDQRKIWCRARDELNMLLVGKTTFLSYIKGNVEEAYSKNIAIEAIEWYLGKTIENMTLQKFLEGLKGMWLAANYFYKIELEKNEKGTFQLRFNHELTKEYSIFWAKYFEKILIDNWGCFVEAFIRNESFYLIIRAIDPR
jgi:predicted CopG family antitoxin